MVAQTRIDAPSLAGKPVAAGKKGEPAEAIADRKDLTEDQAAAAAVVDVEQSEAVAAQVPAGGGIEPTAAPVQSMGEVAQAPAPTTTDTTTTTTPPPMVEESSGVSPWVIGGAALLGVGAIAAVANNDDDDDSPAAAPPPGPPGGGPSPGPAPVPGNAAPTSESKTVTLPADNAPTPIPITYTDAENDQLQSITIGTITTTPISSPEGAALQFNTANGHGYQLVEGVDITWDAANAAATAAGGHLATIESVEEMTFIQTAYNNLGGSAAGTFPAPGAASGQDGTWIGLQQTVTTGAPGDGWKQVDVGGVAGAAFPGDSPLWNNDFGGLPLDGGDGENGSHQFGAIYNGLNASDTALIYDAIGTAGAGAQDRYLIEFDNPLALTAGGAPVANGAVIAAADLPTLTWNSVFNDGGSFTYTVTAAAGTQQPATYTVTLPPPPVAIDAGPSQSIAMMVEDQPVLA